MEGQRVLERDKWRLIQISEVACIPLGFWLPGNPQPRFTPLGMRIMWTLCLGCADMEKRTRSWMSSAVGPLYYSHKSQSSISLGEKTVLKYILSAMKHQIPSYMSSQPEALCNSNNVIFIVFDCLSKTECSSLQRVAGQPRTNGEKLAILGCCRLLCIVYSVLHVSTAYAWGAPFSSVNPHPPIPPCISASALHRGRCFN